MKARSFPAGEPLPVTLSREELASVIGKSLSRLDELRRLGTHPAIKELLPRVGAPTFCGKTAQAWLDQRSTTEEIRFFRTHRPAGGRSPHVQ